MAGMLMNVQVQSSLTAVKLLAGLPPSQEWIRAAPVH
jgi:hypothetical protein